MKYEYHEYANLFPLIEGQAFDDLCNDIKEFGQREPIVLYKDQILDGRNRYRACLEVGVEPEFTVYNEDFPLEYVISLNMHRRHLSESQRAMVAAKLANLTVGGNGNNQHVSNPANLPHSSTSNGDAARLLNVSERSIRTAKVVKDRGVPELSGMVERGEVSVSAAKAVADLSSEEQLDAVSQGPAAIKDVARQARSRNVTKINDKYSGDKVTPHTLVWNLRSLCSSLKRDAKCVHLTPESMAQEFREGLNRGHNAIYWETVEEVAEGLEMFYKAIMLVKTETTLKDTKEQ